MRNRERANRNAARWRERNPERVAEVLASWQRRHPDRVAVAFSRRRAKLRAVQHTLTRQQWSDILAYFGNRCAYCLAESPRLTLDHIEPLSRGGHHIVENVAPACRHCNPSKSDYPLLIWLWREAA